MAADAAGRVGEVLLAVLMARQAAVATRADRRFVPAVAAVAGGVFFDLMEAGKLGRGVTALAGWGTRDAFGAVRPVTVRAGGGAASVRCLRLLGVARRARGFDAAGVRLVTAPAVLVASWGAALLSAVAAAAILGLGASVRFVAARTLLMAGVCLSLLRPVTGATALDAQLRPMGQAGVATLTRLVPSESLHAGQLRRVAALASAAIGGLADEVMGLMATLAIDAAMKGLVAARFLVARAASAHTRSDLVARGVRIMTPDAAANLALLGVIRVLVGVTAGAGLVGATRDIVRRVAARTLAMTARVSRAEHCDVFMTAATGDGLLFAELMRLVTANASNVPPFEQRRRGHDRLRLLVAGHARAERLDARGVLLVVTRRANLVRRLARERVRGLNVLMTLRTGARYRCAVFVRTVAVQALAGVVDLHGRGQGLARSVAVQAVTGLVRMSCAVADVLEATHCGAVTEAVAQRTVALHVGPKAYARLGGSVRDARLFFVAFRAAGGCYSDHFRVADRVTRATGDLLFDHVSVMTVARARLSPAGGHVHAASRVRHRGTVAAGASHHDQQLHESRQPVAQLGGEATPHGAAPNPR